MWQTVNITSPEPGFATGGRVGRPRQRTPERDIIMTMAIDWGFDRAIPAPYPTATWG
jgi:hypothetical protein